MNRQRFEKLFEPGRIGQMDIRNRIVMPAMASPIKAADDGSVSESVKDYFEARSKGGAGLIIVGYATIDFPASICGKPRLGVDDDKYIPGLSELAQVVHRHGAKIALQLCHPGPSIIQSLANMQPMAASAVVRPADYIIPSVWVPRELPVTEIAEITDRFTRAAVRAQKAGFDGVEIHAAHRYLVNSFLSPFYNQRKDNYGGSLENRARFLVEILNAVRGAVGAGYPLWCRINAREDDVEAGITVELAGELAQLLQKTGLLDAINVTCQPTSTPGNPPGYNVDAAALIKKVVDVPVMVAGRIDPQLGETVLRQEKADFIVMGRGLIADPELPGKLATGRLDDIVPCLRCNTCMKGAPLDIAKARLERFECTVNPSVTREREHATKPAEKSRKILVVGGGPAGMEAAIVAAQRGHKVVLWERERRLGGQLMLASILREENQALIKYLTAQIKKLGVEVELGKAANSELIANIKPDVIVIAEGATSSLPEIPGVNRSNVLSALAIEKMMHGRLDGRIGSRRFLWYFGAMLMRNPAGLPIMKAFLKFWAPFGRSVIVVGKSLHGLEIAEFFARRGKKVTIVDTREKVPLNEPPMPLLRRHLEGELATQKINILTVASYEEITDKGLIVTNKEGKRQFIEGDTIVFVAGYRPKTELSRALAGFPYEVRLIGDCVKPCGILEAIQDGFRIGREI
ncbi:MAG: FAD-dependent oxidoreductase [Chloroflexi bacterium]|nr:FAD-dependent oxidoreductase [Chloroflexota bacterium]